MDYWQHRYLDCLDLVVNFGWRRIKIREEETIKIRTASLALWVQHTGNDRLTIHPDLYNSIR